MSALIQSVRYSFRPDDADEAEAILRELRDASSKEAGVIAFEIARSQEQPNVFAIWEVYRDKAALDAHMATEHFQRLVVNGTRRLAKERHGELFVQIS